MYKLLIVDDEPLIQIGIKSMLNWHELGIELCGVASNGKAALDIIHSDHPDIVVTDLKMPVMSGLELIKICRDQYGDETPAFIILTNYEEFTYVKEALRYKVTDYLVKVELTPQTLRASIERVLEQGVKDTGIQKAFVLDMQALRDKFFVRLLNNLFDSTEQFTVQCRELKLSFEACGYVCACLEFQSCGSTQLIVEKQIRLYGNAIQMLHEIISRYIPCTVISLDLRHCAILFFFGSSMEPPAAYARIKQSLEQVGSMLHKYYNLDTQGGIGSYVTQPLKIADSYQHARIAAANAVGRIQAIDETTDLSKNCRLFNLSLFCEDLSRAYGEFDAELLHKTLSEIIELFHTHPSQYTQVMDCAMNILYLAISLLPDGESLLLQLYQDVPDDYRSLYKAVNVEQVITWMTVFRDRLCFFFQEQRKDYKHHIVINVKHYINNNIRAVFTLNEVASIFGISSNYLSRLFRKYNNMGFNEYVTFQKIQEAKRLLKNSSCKVYEAADLLGFESAFYFSKVFKKVEGISPTEYLNKKTL